MVKQFLLNPDGSIPEGTNVQALIENNIPMVIPRPIPPHNGGEYAIDDEPVLGEDGRLYQNWIITTTPPPELLIAPDTIQLAVSEQEVLEAFSNLTAEQQQLILKAIKL